MSFFSPINFLFLLGTVPIIIMYLLKKKHEEIEISSTFLWQRAVKDIEANAPWQRLRKNILLILQLLAFIMLVFFLMKPYLASDTLEADNLIIVLDKSLSMSTVEEDGSRFERSKEEIENIFKNLKSSAQATLITMGNSPEVIVNSSKDKSILINKLRSIGQGNGADNIDDTLSFIKAMTKNMENYKIIFYTDKAIDTDMDSLVLKNLGSPQNNLAIENLSCKRIKNSIGALIHIKNYGNEHMKSDLIVYSDNEIFDVQEINLQANESKKIYIENIPNGNIVKAEIDVDDPLKADNVRYSVVNNSQIRKVLMVTSGNIFLEKALALSENIELYKTNEIVDDVKGYDLYIYDGMVPKSLPKDGNIFILNPMPLDGVVEIQGVLKEGKLSTEEDDLLRYVDFDISMSKVKLLKTPGWASPFIFSNDEPVAFKGQMENQRLVVLGFDIHDTDFPLRYSFPIFIQNVLDYTLSLNIQESISVLSGEAINIDVFPKTSDIYIINPRRNRIKIGPPFPISTYTDTNETGVYTIEQRIDDETYLNYFVSNVNTIKESNINQTTTEKKESDVRNSIKAKSVKNLKNIFLALALLLLAVEWVVYNRGY